MMDKMDAMQQQFAQTFANPNRPQAFFAPGRINLIGEHIDYNGGFVLPCALDIGTWALAAPAAGERIRCQSLNFPHAGLVEFDGQHLVFEPAHDWANYVKGVLQALAGAGYPWRGGLDLLVYGQIPHGAGLSSSASLEVLVATVIRTLAGHSGLGGSELARLCQQAENEFIGVRCGIMDQFVIANAQAQQAMLLDCASLEYQSAPLHLENCELVIANSNKRRGLADSKYNERRAECESVRQILKTDRPLVSVEEADLAQVADPVLRRRARHVIRENQRTLAAFEALGQGQLARLGELMTQSHRSLRDDYEVTGAELDCLAETAWRHPACLGSRMTGAGFGGCTISLVQRQGLEDFQAQLAAEYWRQTGLRADFYRVGVGEGARAVSPSLPNLVKLPS